MTKFETYLINNGLHFTVAENYNRIAENYAEWVKANNLKIKKVKRSQFTNWLQEYREQGNRETTLIKKERIIKHYYNFLGTKNNPAVSWIKRKKEHLLPPNAISKEELLNIYNSLKPNSPAEYRNRCILGFVLFQGLKRSEIEELRVQDIDLETADVWVQGQRRTNSRRLKLEPCQIIHLLDYSNKFRSAFLINKQDKHTDSFFLSKGAGKHLNNAISIMLSQLKTLFPQIENLLHIRGSVITHWQKQEGIVDAMVKSGHRNISSTQRYQTNKYEELHDLLKSIHPLEQMKM